VGSRELRLNHPLLPASTAFAIWLIYDNQSTGVECLNRSVLVAIIFEMMVGHDDHSQKEGAGCCDMARRVLHKEARIFGVL
jgi:hypothetical protein